MKAIVFLLSTYLCSLPCYASTKNEVTSEWYWLALEMYSYHDATVLMTVDSIVISGDEEYGFTPVIQSGKITTIFGSSVPLSEGEFKFSDTLEFNQNQTTDLLLGDYIVYLCFDENKQVWYKSEPFSIARITKENNQLQQVLNRISDIVTKRTDDKNAWCD